MQYGVLRVSLNAVTKIPLDQYTGFKLFSSIKEGLPYGYVDILDRDSKILAEFENLQIGAAIDIEFVNVENEEDIIELPTYYILQIEDDCLLDVGQYAGTIRIWFGHPWFLFKDVKNHAYKATNSAELIKKILKNGDRGKVFPAIDNNFDKTDDAGVPRYKICETDWDFIQNKILPYTASGQLPVHFFCNDKQEFFLKSFQNLYKENSKFIFIPPQNKLGDEKVLEDITAICDDNNIKKGTNLFSIQEASIQVGSFASIPEFAPSFYFENLINSTHISGGKVPINQLKARMGPNFANIMPLDANYMLNVKGTSTKIIHNRQVLDSLCFLMETGKHIDEMFTVTLTTPFILGVASIGSTAEVYLPKMKIDNRLKKHWINGKWLLLKQEHFSDEDDPKKLLTKSTIIRPTFVGKDTDTTLSMPVFLYET